jgi:hypothetical protein
MNHDLPSPGAGDDPHPGGQTIAELFLGREDMRIGTILGPGAGFFLLQAGHQALRFPGGESALQNHFGQPLLKEFVGDAQQRAGLPGGQPPLLQHLLDRFGQLEQPQAVGDRGPTLPQTACQVFLAEPLLFGQEAIGAGLLHGVEVLPLDVFQQRQLQHFIVGHVEYDDGDFRKTRFLGGTPTALAGHDFVPVTVSAYHNGLNDAVFPDGLGQFAQGFIGEAEPRLLGIGEQQVDIGLLGTAVGRPGRQ